MSHRFHVDLDSTHGADLMRYCKMENLPIAILLCVDKPKKRRRFRLKSLVYYFLQRVDRRLNVTIERLSADVEHSKMAQGQLL